MDRGKSILGKKPAKGKGALPPGDLFALGSKPSRSGEAGYQKSASGSSIGEKRPSPFGDRKSASLLAPPQPVSKKPKILSSAQTFTPLGRPSDRDSERRLSPVPPISHAYEESAIDVDNIHLLSEIVSAEDSNDFDRLEGLLCGAVKYLHGNRSKPDNIVFLTLMHLAKVKPNVFNSELVIEAFCSLLKRDMSLNFKSKGNSLVSVLTCNVLMAAYADEDNWPDDFVKVYIDDALGERVWVDRADCKGFVDNIATAFNTNLPKPGMGLSDAKTEPGSASPVVSLGDEEDSSKMEIDTEKSTTSNFEHQNVPTYARYPYQVENIQSFVMEIVRDQLIKRQLMDASAKSLIRLFTVICGYGEARLLAAQKLELWLQNPKLARAAQELLMSVCLNCSQHDSTDMEVIPLLIKMRMKTKPLINHYLACIRELLGQHADNLQMVLTHTIYNELSTTRNPNNMSLIGAVFQTKPEPAAQILAEIFQDLLTNKDDYLRALRALLREIVRTLRYDFNFAAFCLALMQRRTEAKFTDMEPAFKERYMQSVTDLVTMCVLQAITPGVREAVTALARGDKKDVDTVHQYQSLVSTIQRDCIWWLHTIVPDFIEPKQQEFVYCLRKVLFMESVEQYAKDNWPAEADRGAMVRLAMECPVQEDTLMRVLVIGLNRELALAPPEAIEFVDILVRRAANLNAEGRQVLVVERLELFDALLNLCTYRHPENIALPDGYTPPQLAISNLYWKAWTILLIIAAYNPATFGLSAWENYPTLKCMIEIVMTNNYKFPPPTTAVDDSVIEDIRSKEIQVAQKEKQEILEFEGYLAASTTKVTITEANSLLIAQLTSMDPNGAARKPPQQVMDQLRSLNDTLKIGQMLCRSRNPDFLLDIIQRQGTSQSMPWLAELVESSEGSLHVLPVQCLCEFLLHETQDSLLTARDTPDDDTVKFEKHKKKQKQKKQQQLLSRLQTLVHDESTDSSTTDEVMDYFLKRLASTQAANRQLATKGLSMIISRSQLSPTEEGRAITEGGEEHSWLLHHLPSLPRFHSVREKVCMALRQAILIDCDTSLVSAYLQFLSQHSSHLPLQDLDKLTLDIANLIVERTTILSHILPMDGSPAAAQGQAVDTLQALISLFVMYLRKAKEPNTAAYTWSNTQDQIIVQWESGESTTMHILVVHAMIILLSYGPGSNDGEYCELLETWFPARGKPPSAFFLGTSEEAPLLPDWLKLRMIRSHNDSLINAALQDLDPSQLLLFVQSFGIPVHSMCRLLASLDVALGVEQFVIDKAYMAQLIEVQHRRGATGGEKFYSMLTNGQTLDVKTGDTEIMETDTDADVSWKCPSMPTSSQEPLPSSHVANLLLQTFDPSGRKSPDTDIHFRTLTMAVSKNNKGAVNVARGLSEVLHSSSGSEFAEAFLTSTYAASLMRLVLARKHGSGMQEVLQPLMLRLSSSCTGTSTPVKAMVHEYLRSGAQRAPTKPSLRTDSSQQFLQDVSRLAVEGGPVEEVIQECMRDLLATHNAPLAARLVMAGLMACQTSTDREAFSPSLEAMFIDFLDRLDPEVIRLVPDLQGKLLFCMTPGHKAGNQTAKEAGNRVSRGQPYLLALLTHNSSWETLHHCITSLLADADKGYDAVSVLDFLWACIYIPKLWQGREKRLPKNASVEDVLGLTGSQLIVLVHYIIQEAMTTSPGHQSADPVSANEFKPAAANESSESIQHRIGLLQACLAGEEEKVKTLVQYIEPKMHTKNATCCFYESLMLELYLKYPYILSWMSNTKWVTTDTKVSPRTETQMDLITHRLITGLCQGNKSKRNDSRMADVNIACRKLAAEHPILVLRQLPAIVALLKGKTQFTYAEFRQRNLMTLYTYVLGILELLQPNIFHREHTALNDILEEYFNLLSAYSGVTHKQMAPIIVKLVQFLNQYVTYDSNRANHLLQSHVILLSNVLTAYPDLSVLKSLLAGLTLPRQGPGEATASGSDSGGVLYPTRPSSPWQSQHLAPFLHKIKKDNPDDVLAVLQDLDETSKRKIEILDHFVEDLKRLMSTYNDQCRNTAFELTKRFLRQNPKKAADFVATFLHCLEDNNPDIVTSALTNLAEFTLLCQEFADVILQKALSAGINTSIETSSYISDSLQLLNLDLATT